MIVEDKSPDKSRKNISDSWIEDVIFVGLKNLLGYEMSAREGCLNLQEFISQYPNLSSQPDFFEILQMKNAGLFLSEFELLLTNVSGLLKTEKYNEFRRKLKVCRDLYNGSQELNGEKIPVYEKVRRIRVNKSFTKLTWGYTVLLNNLYSLREELVEQLNPVLFKYKNNEREGAEQR